TSPKKAERGLCVSVLGEKTVTGWEALLAIADALWFGRRPLLLLGPFVRRRLVRRFAQMASEPVELDKDFGVQHLPGQADAAADAPPAARQAVRNVLASLREAAVVLVLAACGTQLLLENRAVPAWAKPAGLPRVFQDIIAYPRIFQGWSMFAP